MCRSRSTSRCASTAAPYASRSVRWTRWPSIPTPARPSCMSTNAGTAARARPAAQPAPSRSTCPISSAETPRLPMKRHTVIVSVVTAVAALTSGCSLESLSQSSGVVNVVVGYQSKTINTVTAGTLMRAQGYLQRRLADITTRTGTKYAVRWQDYDTGAPITAQMLAEKIDIGSMGDYPMLINGSKTQSNPLARTEMVSVTGYNPKGALNMVVVAPNSSATELADLAGTKVSASVGSAGHGTLVRALKKAGVSGVEVLNQQPQVGASALESGS